ncbi:MAG: hypothetical protein L0322_21295, partial [Chloroflexi bacterium]|nr:hypothetical protein [Chloroflexota bacterium]
MKLSPQSLRLARPTSLSPLRGLATAGLFLLLAAVFMGRTLWPPAGQALGGYDMRGYYYVLHQAVRQALAGGRLPVW